MDQKEKKEKANLIIGAQKELIQKIADKLKSEVQQKLLEGIEGTSTEKYILKKKAEFNALKKRAGQEIKDAQKTAVSTFKTDLAKLGEHNVKDYAATVRNLYKTLNKNLTYEIDESLKQISFKSRSAVAPDLYKTIASVVRGNARNNYVIYKDGKHVGLDNYMEMRLRTDINHEISTEMVQINQEIGQVFYMCSEHGNCADDHLDYHGRIYCSENWEDTCPLKFRDQVADYIKQNDIMSVEDAMGEKGNYLTTRPNCRHYFQMVAITDVLSLKAEKDKKEFKEENGLSYKTSYKENDYKALQTQRLNERNIRKFKCLESAEKALIEGYEVGSPERIAAENRRKEYSLKKRAFQKKQRELMKAHPNLDRDYGREALDRFRKYDPKAEGDIMLNDEKTNKKTYESYESKMERISTEQSKNKFIESEKIEPVISNDLKDIETKTRVKLFGFGFRLKTQESLKRKIKSDATTFLKEGLTEKEAILKATKKIHDGNRYTFILNVDTFVEDYFEIQENLIKKGYKQFKCKNTLGDKEKAYRGINNQYTKGESFVEIQFHTNASIEIKDKNHKLYEISRLDTTSKKEKEKLQEEMKKNNECLIIPKNIDKIK